MYASVAQITQNREHQDEGVHLSSSPHSFLFFSLSSPGAPPMPPTPVALQLRYSPDSRPHCTRTPRRLQGVSSAARLVCLVSCTASRYRRFQSPVPPFLCARVAPALSSSAKLRGPGTPASVEFVKTPSDTPSPSLRGLRSRDASSRRCARSLCVRPWAVPPCLAIFFAP